MRGLQADKADTQLRAQGLGFTELVSAYCFLGSLLSV